MPTKDSEMYMYAPATTVILEQMTFVTDRPANAHAYYETRFPRLRARPPAIAIRTEGQLSCICHDIETECAEDNQEQNLVLSLIYGNG
jgi:hypothetical protein